METFLAVAIFALLFLLFLLDWRLLIALKDDMPFNPLYRRMVDLYWQYHRIAGFWAMPVFAFYMGTIAAWAGIRQHGLLFMVAVGYFLLHVRVYQDVLDRRPFLNDIEDVLSITSTQQYRESADDQSPE